MFSWATSSNPPPPAPPPSVTASTSGSTAETASSATNTTVTSNHASTISPAPPSTASSAPSPRFPGQLAPPGPANAGIPHPGGPGIGPAHRPPHLQHLQQQRPLTNTLPPIPSPSTQRQITDARNALIASIGNMVDSDLQARAQQLHGNNAAIEKQQRDLINATEGLRRENDRLQQLAADTVREMKPVGHVQNFAEFLEREFLVLEETMRLVREGSEGSDSWSGSYSWSGSGTEGPSREGSVVGEDEGRIAGPVDEDSRAATDADGDVPMADDQELLSQPPSPRLDKGKGKEILVPEFAGESHSARPDLDGLNGAEAKHVLNNEGMDLDIPPVIPQESTTDENEEVVLANAPSASRPPVGLTSLDAIAGASLGEQQKVEEVLPTLHDSSGVPVAEKIELEPATLHEPAATPLEQKPNLVHENAAITLEKEQSGPKEAEA